MVYCSDQVDSKFSQVTMSHFVLLEDQPGLARDKRLGAWKQIQMLALMYTFRQCMHSCQIWGKVHE